MSDAPTQVNLQRLRARRQEILQSAAQHGARNVRVFGSTARGASEANSDVDLLVEMEPGAQPARPCGPVAGARGSARHARRRSQRRRRKSAPAGADLRRGRPAVKDQRVYILHAVDAIDAILRYTADGRDAFFSDRKTQDAVIRNIEIIGQAVKGLSSDTRGLEPEVPWRQIAGMRDNSSTNTSASTSRSSGMSSSASLPHCSRSFRI